MNILTHLHKQEYNRNLCLVFNSVYEFPGWNNTKWQYEQSALPTNYHTCSEQDLQYLDIDLIVCQDINYYPFMKKYADSICKPIVYVFHENIQQKLPSDCYTICHNELKDNIKIPNTYNNELFYYNNDNRQQEIVTVLSDGDNPKRAFVTGFGNYCTTVLDYNKKLYKFYLYGHNPNVGSINVKQNHLVDIFHNASIFFNPTQFDYNNQSMIEAMACGCIPVVWKNIALKSVPDICTYSSIREAYDKITFFFNMKEEERENLRIKIANKTKLYHDFNKFKKNWESLICNLSKLSAN